MSRRRPVRRLFTGKEAGLPISELEGLVRIMDENRLTEVTVDDGYRRLALKRDGGRPVGGLTAEGDVGGDPLSAGLVTVQAPAVGIFFRSPSPGMSPFVEVGKVIEPGQVVGLIETLKVISEVTSDVRGLVIGIEVDDGGMVEFGQTLLVCEEMDQGQP
ncbi:MAG: hypothetical protein KKB90_05330 [Actinobacteria bacterium]|nr:hypothetical protein [Actinomycetota bacterium]MCG2817779.1 hypothetical protein [Actinomycetes bacterium]MBU4218369.1 hypothetical protein [Actinomycetota bacterium]MBU4359646.1 hypothetical protein [Actinomycetota bacterium]MBU4391903.1 hypothetical protein [Actinomycetota bacterium]